MKIRNKHTSKVQDVAFSTWFPNTPNKEDFIVLDWGDLVYWQLIKDGKRIDHRIMDRDHALRIIEMNDRENSMRELTESDWILEIVGLVAQSPESQTFDDINVNTMFDAFNKELHEIEKKFLQYIVLSKGKTKSTKTFADSNSYKVQTINDVALKLKQYYLVTLESAAGIDQKTKHPFSTYLCEPTPLGIDFITKNQQFQVRIERREKGLPVPVETDKKTIIVKAQEWAKIAPLGILGVGIISTILMIYFNGCFS